jgi:nucleoside 2-deoxyribosyltransferase
MAGIRRLTVNRLAPTLRLWLARCRVARRRTVCRFVRIPGSPVGQRHLLRAAPDKDTGQHASTAARPGLPAHYPVAVRLYFAGPLFTSPERTWNAELAGRLLAAGNEVFLPQDQETDGNDPAGIFRRDRDHIDWAQALVAVMDGADPDSGTCWECGYAYGTGKPVILVRTDFRGASEASPYNSMLIESAAVRVELPTASMDVVAAAVLEALERIRP